MRMREIMTDLGKRLTRADYAKDATALARTLIGRVLVRTLDDGTRLAGIIVETEAYLGVKDAASHAHNGRRTPRNEAMYARAGTAYVYFTYGMHYCFNVVCGDGPGHGIDQPDAILIRALEPIEGLERMQELRSVKLGKTGAGRAASGMPSPRMLPTALCSGPARLCQALAIDRGLNGVDLTGGSELFICEPPRDRPPPRRGSREIVRDSRIGIAYSGKWAAKPLRFVLQDNPHVSVPPGRAR